MIRDGPNVAAALDAARRAPLILEGFVAFEREVSVVAARGLDGADRVLTTSARTSIATTSSNLARARRRAGSVGRRGAAAIARRDRSTALDYVGVLGGRDVRRRATAGGEALLVNEIAPRVHNSGHWTHRRRADVAVRAAYPRGRRLAARRRRRRRGRVEMHNLIGDDAEDWRDILAQPDLALHLYGKPETGPGRKMGHVTRVLPEASKAP